MAALSVTPVDWVCLLVSGCSLLHGRLVEAFDPFVLVVPQGLALGAHDERVFVFLRAHGTLHVVVADNRTVSTEVTQSSAFY